MNVVAVIDATAALERRQCQAAFARRCAKRAREVAPKDGRSRFVEFEQPDLRIEAAAYRTDAKTTDAAYRLAPVRVRLRQPGMACRNLSSLSNADQAVAGSLCTMTDPLP